MQLKFKGLFAGATALVMSASASMAETVLTYSSWLPWGHPVNTAIYIPWMEAIEADSEGRIKFNRLPKPVGSPPAHLDAVRTGQADVAMSVHGYSRQQFTAYVFGELPFLGSDAEITSIALQRTHDKFLADKDLYKGAHLIGVNVHGPGQLHLSSKVLDDPNGLDGQKIRTGGPVPLAIVEAWGGVSIRQPAPKSYEILSTGIADGITFPWESLSSFKITELVPYTTEIEEGWYDVPMYLVMNKRAYDSLPAEDKAIVDKHSGEAFAKMAGMGWNKINAAGRQSAMAAGNTIEPASDTVRAALTELNAKLEADYISQAEAAGIDGAALLAYFRAEVDRLKGGGS